MLKLFKYLKPHALSIVIICVLTYLLAMTNLALPDYMAKIVNEGIVGENNSIVINTGIRMLLVSLFGALCTVIIGYLSAKVAVGFGSSLRERIFSRVESFSMAEFNQFSTASLITRSTNDIQQVQMVLVMILRMVLSAPIIGVGAVIKAYNLAPSMSWIMALAVGVMLALIAVIFSIALPKFKLLQKLVDKLNLVTRQNLTGLRVIRAFNNEKFEEKKFDAANQELTSVNLFVNKLMVLMQPMMMLIFNFTMIGIVWVGARMIGNGNLQIGDMMAFMQYSLQVIMSFLMVSIIFIMVPRASVSGQRISEVDRTHLSIKDPEKPVKLSSFGEGEVEFRDVSFSYPSADTPVLEKISFSAEPGETTAIIGSTGSGKSTLINLIPRFYDATHGEVLIDGINVKEMRLSDLYNKVGYVPQKGVLFSGTVESNIKYGMPEATEQETHKAAKIAQAYDFVEHLPEKFNNSISQGGTNVSGGQKQRLSIARAIIRKPEIYIFDDSFSALDFKTDAMLRAALKSEMKNKTVIIVAQRVSTILNAEKIIVLDEGRIVGIGTHKELLKKCKVYEEIASSQLSQEELETSKSSVAPINLEKELV